MKKGLFCRLAILGGLVCALAGYSLGATLVPPGNVFGSWTVANSPYIIKTGNITVPNGQTLLIQAGVEVHFSGHHKFIVNGHLRALGTEQDSIIFTAKAHEGTKGWKGLRLVGADSTRFEYCRIENGNAILGNASDSTGGGAFISGAGSHVIFRHCTFADNYAGGNAGGLFISGATSAECTDCLFDHNYSAKDGGASFVNNSSGTRFERCEFTRNRSNKEAGAVHSRFGAPQYIDCYFHHNTSYNSGGAVTASGQPSFRRCVFERNSSEESQGGGLYFYDSTTTATLDSCLIIQNKTFLRDGGGAYCWESSPRFTDCDFIENVSSDDGGGIHCYRLGANPIFTRCRFEGNSAADRGGGIKISRYSNAVLNDCQIRNNRSYGTGGGGVFCRLQCEPVITNCVIENNYAVGTGGGVGAIESNPHFFNCVIRNNTTDSLGGGVFGYAADVDLTDCDVSYNFARINGGGVSLNLSSPDLLRCRIQNNSADSLGGGLYMVESLPPIVNCLITDNRSGIAAGGSYVNISSPAFRHCTIANNSAPVGHTFVVVNSPGELVNSIVSGIENPLGPGGAEAGVGFDCGSIPWTIRNSLFHSLGFPAFAGSFPAGFGALVSINPNGTSSDGYGNIFVSPRFTGTNPEPYALALTGTSSPALNCAYPTSTNTDLSGLARPGPVGSLSDLGCFESNQSQIGTGLWGVIPDTVRAGFHNVYGDIIVPAGTELVIEGGAHLNFMGPYSVLAYGKLVVAGAAADSVIMTADSISNLTLWRGIRFAGTESSNSELSYLSLSHAKTWPVDSSGGALGVFDGASPLIQFSHIQECLATSSGGAVRVVSGSPVFDHCKITSSIAPSGGAMRVELLGTATLSNSEIRNCAAELGGAISIEGGTINLVSSILENNLAGSGGAVNGRNAQISLNNTTLRYNTASQSGGALSTSNSQITCSGATVANNVAPQGGAFYCVSSTGSLNNIIAHDNQATDRGGFLYGQLCGFDFGFALMNSNEAAGLGGAFYLVSDSSTVSRSTIVGNSASAGSAFALVNSTTHLSSSQITDNDHALYFSNSASSHIEFCNFIRNSGADFQFIQDNPVNAPASIGELTSSNILEYPSDPYANTYADPLYYDFADGDYRIGLESPCMDAGDPNLDCDSDLTYIEIGAFHTPYPINPWPPDELSVVLNDSSSMSLYWSRSKPVRLCNPEGLMFAVEQLDSLGNWQTITVTADSSCQVPLLGGPEQVVPVRVRSLVAP